MIGFDVLTLLGGLTTGIATGVAGNAVYAGLSKTKLLLPITDHRKRSLTKNWRGSFIMPEENGKFEEVEISLHLEVKGKSILGSGSYSNTTLSLKGGFFRDDYFYLNYENSDKAIFQRGMMIFYWPNNPVEIKGKFLGIRRVKDRIAAGDIVLRVK